MLVVENLEGSEKNKEKNHREVHNLVFTSFT